MAEGDGKLPRNRDNSGRDLGLEMAVGARIRATRVAAGMTQRALGDAVGIAYQKLQKYELGQDRIAISTLQRIARALDLHPGELFDDPMPRAAAATLDAKVVRCSLELVEVVHDPRVIRQVLALVRELKEGARGRESRSLESPAAPPEAETDKKQAPRAPARPTQAVVDALLEMLRQSTTGDAGALARLLGQALAEAEKIVNEPA